jgi:hypothetical protein
VAAPPDDTPEGVAEYTDPDLGLSFWLRRAAPA